MGLPFALNWNSSVLGLAGFTLSFPPTAAAARPSGLFPSLTMNLRLKCDRNLRFSCCWCWRTTSNLSPNRAWNFFWRLGQRYRKKLHLWFIVTNIMWKLVALLQFILRAAEVYQKLFLKIIWRPQGTVRFYTIEEKEKRLKTLCSSHG